MSRTQFFSKGCNNMLKNFKSVRKAILTIFCFSIVFICSTVFAEASWVLVPETDGLYVDKNYVIYNQQKNSIVTQTLSIADSGKKIYIIFKEEFFYSNKTNAILAQTIIMDNQIFSNHIYEPKEIKAEHIKLNSSVEKAYYFLPKLLNKP